MMVESGDATIANTTVLRAQWPATHTRNAESLSVETTSACKIFDNLQGEKVCKIREKKVKITNFFEFCVISWLRTRSRIQSNSSEKIVRAQEKHYGKGKVCESISWGICECGPLQSKINIEE